MSRWNVAAIAALLALAAVLGTAAVTHTVALGSAQRQKADAVVRQRARQVAAYEAALRRSLARKPPSLPPVPKVPVRSSPAPIAQPRVVYRRPPAVVIVKHTHRGDEGYEAGDGGGDD